MIVLTAAFVVSCADDMEVNNGNDGQEGKTLIQFNVDDSQEWMEMTGEQTAIPTVRQETVALPQQAGTRAYILKSVTKGINRSDNNQTTRALQQTSVQDNFGVSGYYYSGGSSLLSTTQAEFFNVEATKSNNSWTLSSPQYWPSAGQVAAFYAYSPYQTSGTGDGITLSPATGVPYIDYVVPENPEDQKDLMTAASRPREWDRGVSATLQFRHALTCIKFKLGNNFVTGKKIKVIRLKNVIGRGRFHPDYDDPCWTLGSAKEDTMSFSAIDLNYEISNANRNKQIVPENGDANYSTFLMIPQTLGASNQMVVVEFDDGGEPLQAELTGTWAAGTTVTYTLSGEPGTLKYVLEVGSATASHNGGESSFTVSSYRQQVNNPNVKEAVEWKVTGYSVDGGATFTREKPLAANWAAIYTTGGTGSLTYETGKVGFLPQTSTASTSIADETADNAAQKMLMQSNGVRGADDNYIDLSKINMAGYPTLRNTANCYVVNAPGYYRIPLVYGNAIKNGQINTVAVSGSPHVDYKNAAISAAEPYISNSGTPKDAVVIWEDTPSQLISTISLDESKEYLQFYIPYDNIQQGNALIAVRDIEGTIMWSWHIWVTALDLLATIDTYTSSHQLYRIMPVNLGWCSTGGTMLEYAPRDLILRVEQTGGETAFLHVTQYACKHYESSERGNHPYFQWGRKDPMRPGVVTGTGTSATPSDKSIRQPSGYVYNTQAGPVDYYWSISHPHLFITFTGAKWMTAATHYPNVWSANATAGLPAANTKPIKTIYDPCPVGFHIPDANFMIGQVLHGTFDCGWHFYTDQTNTKSFFMPTNGCRYGPDGSLLGINNTTENFYWSANITDDSGAYYLRIEKNGNNFHPAQPSGWEAFGMPERPEAE
jgi:hypothetical protein